MKNEKAKKLVELGKILPAYLTDKFERYLVISKDTYTVRYDIIKDIWLCNCKNIRNDTCYHIEAVKLFKNI